MNTSRKPSFTVITGGKEELECKKHILFSTPEVLDQQEFESLCDSLDLRLADVEPLIARRLRCNAKDALERNLVLAIIDGDTDEYNRLSDVIGRRNSLSLKVISSS
ncbi:MAG: hypothetical protein Q7U37_10660 [Gallionella sp.]|jgi:hypothetical protein|nr:hypothetical protein [Gallionella sp.]